MIYLIEAALEFGLEGIVEQAMSHKNVHGVMVGIHPAWLKAWKFHQMFPDRSSELDHYYYDYWLYKTASDDPDTISNSVETKLDVYWRPSSWMNEPKKATLVVVILLRPGSERIQIKYEGQLRIIQEFRPVPVMMSNSRSITRPLQGGVSISNNNKLSGTIGGILIDPKTGKKYGVTCAHVINSIGQDVYQPSLSDSGKASIIGKSILAELPVVKGTGICNRYNAGMVFNEMDLALVEIDESVNANLSILNIGRIKGVTPSYLLPENLSVEFNGRSSGHKSSLVLGKIGVVNEVESPNGIKHCFNHLIELKQPSRFSLLFERPVKGGDSGAWIIVQGQSGIEWAGMVVGQDSQTGYAIMSERIQAFLQSKGYTLNCC